MELWYIYLGKIKLALIFLLQSFFFQNFSDEQSKNVFNVHNQASNSLRQLPKTAFNISSTTYFIIFAC